MIFITFKFMQSSYELLEYDCGIISCTIGLGNYFNPRWSLAGKKDVLLQQTNSSYNLHVQQIIFWNMNGDVLQMCNKISKKKVFRGSNSGLKITFIHSKLSHQIYTVAESTQNMKRTYCSWAIRFLKFNFHPGFNQGWGRLFSKVIN